MSSASRFVRAPFARAAQPSSFLAARRPFHRSSAVAAGKESKLHEENRAQEAEDAKQAQLKAQKEGKGQWTDSLASDSESIVKADKGELDAGKKTISELQKESAKAAQREQK